MEHKNDIVNNNYDLHNGKHYSMAGRNKIVIDKNVQTVGDRVGQEMIKLPNGQTATTSTATEEAGITMCTPHVCRQARQNYAPPDLANDSPWNRKKTYFFLGTLIVFIIWLVIYSCVTSYGLV